MNVAYNRDCMDVMKEYPDGYFDLAVVDPPYGDALHTDGGGNMGWFTKYREDSRDGSQTVHVERERENAGDRSTTCTAHDGRKNGDGWNRFGQRFDRYKHETAPIPRGKQEPERPMEPIPQTERQPKKLYRGT